MKKLDNLLFTASCDFVPVRKVLVSIQTISLQTWYVICLTYVCPLLGLCVASRRSCVRLCLYGGAGFRR